MADGIAYLVNNVAEGKEVMADTDDFNKSETVTNKITFHTLHTQARKVQQLRRQKQLRKQQKSPQRQLRRQQQLRQRLSNL